jgi:hypothetical protein
MGRLTKSVVLFSLINLLGCSSPPNDTFYVTGFEASDQVALQKAADLWCEASHGVRCINLVFGPWSEETVNRIIRTDLNQLRDPNGPCKVDNPTSCGCNRIGETERIFLLGSKTSLDGVTLESKHVGSLALHEIGHHWNHRGGVDHSGHTCLDCTDVMSATVICTETNYNLTESDLANNE